MASPEARDLMVPEATVEAALTEVSGRHPDFDAFQDDLSGNGLSIPLYRLSLERELKVEAVLEKVDSRAARVSDIDVELYYHYHPEPFQRPEARVARHILITVNPELADNSREAATTRIQAVLARLVKDPKRF
ncbi:MAG TPA: hypothetical protein PLW81_14375 [Thiobacillaceae bacterium]|nr:hypothetical protein [Thiobacillaceae bacterium]